MANDLKRLRPDEDPTVIEAISEGRHADDIYIIACPFCGCYSYWNQGSHADCRNCGANLYELTDEAITLEDYWTEAPYPCDN